MTTFRAAILLLMAIAAWLCLAALPAGCAAHLPPLPSPTSDVFLIPETTSSVSRVCVRVDPFLDATLACVTVGDLRRLLRSQKMARF